MIKVSITNRIEKEDQFHLFPYMVTAKTWLLLNGFLPDENEWYNNKTSEKAKIEKGDFNEDDVG